MTIGSVTDFIEEILGRPAPGSSVLAYRGHASQLFALQPSVFRDDLFKKNEHILLRELVASHPKEFSDDVDTLEKLVRLQHYSLPTRLLDVSWNPLVALYFACQSEKRRVIDPRTGKRVTIESDGEVIITGVNRARLRYFDSDTVACLANLANLKSTLKEKINTGLVKEKFNETLPIRRLVHFIRQEKMQFEPEIIPADLHKIVLVKPKLNNKRILAQDGAFFVFGIAERLEEGNDLGISIQRIRIPAISKSKILRQLDRLAINQKTLFPEIDSAATYFRQNMRSNSFLSKILVAPAS